MPKGLSLHIGINELRTGFYLSSGALCSPEKDARAMAAIAIIEGYHSPELLINENATKSSFLNHLDKNIEHLDAGDTFLLTFSGHGGQIKDTNGDEKDGLDETWCLYDEHLIDDEIGEKWKKFKPGVQVIVISSSCHSRTAIRVWDQNCLFNPTSSPVSNCEKEIIVNEKTILSSHIQDPEIKADIIHISACEDKQIAQDGDCFSKFTTLLLKYWDYGRFNGSYDQLITNIKAESGYNQKPGITTLGSNHFNLQHRLPFKLLTT